MNKAKQFYLLTRPDLDKTLVSPTESTAMFSQRNNFIVYVYCAILCSDCHSLNECYSTIASFAFCYLHLYSQAALDYTPESAQQDHLI